MYFRADPTKTGLSSFASVPFSDGPVDHLGGDRLVVHKSVHKFFVVLGGQFEHLRSVKFGSNKQFRAVSKPLQKWLRVFPVCRRQLAC